MRLRARMHPTFAKICKRHSETAAVQGKGLVERFARDLIRTTKFIRYLA